MKPHIFNHILRLLLVILLIQFGCTQEPREVIQPDPDSGQEVTITVNIPGNQTPATRSIAEWGGEAAVETIDILIFEQTGGAGSPEVLAEHVSGKNISQSSSAGDRYKVQFQAALAENAQARTIVILANVPAASITGAANPGTPKQTVLEALRYASVNQTGTPEGWKWKANESGKINPVAGTDYNLIPMYGEQVLASGVTAGMKIQDIDLVRMLARIDVLNSADSDFTLTQIYLVNYNTAGYIAPAWNPSNGVLLPDLPNDPMVPVLANPQLGAANGMSYTYSNPGGEGLAGVIYTYEAAKAVGGETDQSRINAPCLVVKGTYAVDGKDYYYRIDFTDSEDAKGNKPGEAGFDPSTVDYLPLYRNHRYLFDIVRAEGVGYGTFEQALRSLPVLSGLKVNLHVIDETGVQSIVWNGQHYLGVGSMTDLPAEGGTFQAKVVTNYYAGWEIDTAVGSNGIEYSGSHSDWILSVTPSTDKITVVIDANPDTEDGRQAWVHVKAGRLSHKVWIEQTASTSTVRIGGPANCYLLEPGESLLIPVSRANEGWPGSISDGDLLSGELVWTDNPLGIDPQSNIAHIEAQGTGPEGYVLVQAGEDEGNAVVSVSVGGVIQWSWHIWVTHDQDIIEYGHPGNTDWMDRNLGSFGNEFTFWNDYPIYGTFYQWGRKDPFPPVNNRYDASGAPIEWPNIQKATSVEETIRQPTQWTSNQYFTSFNGSNGDKSWDDKGKTVYDPCPYGWKVPLDSDYTGKITNDLFPYTEYGRYSAELGGFHIMVGTRQEDNGASFTDVGGSTWRGTGWYWTALSSGTTGNALKFNEWGTPDLTTHGKRYGKQIRCIRDK